MEEGVECPFSTDSHTTRHSTRWTLRGSMEVGVPRPSHPLGGLRTTRTLELRTPAVRDLTQGLLSLLQGLLGRLLHHVPQLHLALLTMAAPVLTTRPDATRDRTVVVGRTRQLRWTQYVRPHPHGRVYFQ